jgi:prepilin-type processing-associated H-X9-DG protein
MTDGQIETAGETKAVPRMSKCANAGMWCGLTCIGCLFLGLLLSIFWRNPVLSFLAGALIFMIFPISIIGCVGGGIALSAIENSPGRIKGEGRAWFGFSFCGFMIYLAFIMPTMGKVDTIADRVVCGTNMKNLGNALVVYADEYDGRLPTAEAWCDLLIEKADVSPKSFVCPSSEDKEGECSYALNKYVIGKNLSELSTGMVLLFETTRGREEESYPSIGDRANYGKYPLVQEALESDTKVRLGRWNQVGGPEDLSVGNHEGKGANFVFVDGHSSFEKIGSIEHLRWDPEDESVRWDESMVRESDLYGEAAVPFEVRRGHVRNILIGAGVLAAVCFAFIPGGRMKGYAMVIAGAAAGMGAFWGMASEGFYAEYESTLPRVGWMVGLVWGVLAAVCYTLIMAHNLRRGRVVPLEGGGYRIREDVLGGMWTGLLCSLAVHGTLWMYHLNQQGGGLFHGIYWGMLVGVITGAIARWVFVRWFSENLQNNQKSTEKT